MADEKKKQPTLQDLFDALEEVRAEWDALSTNKDLRFDAERDWTYEACTKSPKISDVALANIESAKNALRNVAAIGITLSPAQKLAYVLVRDGQMKYDVSYMGLMDTAIKSGAIRWAQARHVHANDTFELDGYDRPPLHKFAPFAGPEVRGEVLGVYVVVKTADGDYLTNPMPIADIHAIRARSQSWKSSDGKKGPWVTDAAEMEKKTVVKNAYKYWPRSAALDRAIDYLNNDGGQGIDLTEEDDAKTRLKLWSDKANDAKSLEALAPVWNDGRKVFKNAEDAEGLSAFRRLVEERRVALGGAPTTGKGTPPPPPPPPPSITESIRQQLKESTVDTDFNALAALIDTAPAADQPELNDLYNARIQELWPDDGGEPA